MFSFRETYPRPVHAQSQTPVLTVVIHFPSPHDSCDGQGIYLNRIVPALSRVARRPIHIVALRFGEQMQTERGDGWQVTRVEPHTPLPDVYAAYLPDHFVAATDALAAAALRSAEAMGTQTPAWCHGYETGSAVQALSVAGHRVVGVPHYLVGVESLHDLAVGDDPIRRAAFDSPWATRIGRTVPVPLRPMSIRWASRMGKRLSRAPLPRAIQTQLQKLDQERRFVAHCDALVAVGAGFERAMNTLYPCTVGRSGAVIAGAPTAPLPAAQWPFPERADAIRLTAVGRPTGQKGWDYLAAALHQLEAEDPIRAARLELAIVGGLGSWSGPFSDYSTRVAQSLSSLRHVHIANLGVCPHDQVLATLQGAHVLIHPATFEPLGLVLLEAMAAGCTIIASDADGPADLLEPPWGHLVPFADPRRRSEHLLTAIRQLFECSQSDRQVAGDAARQAARHYTWDRCAEYHLNALCPSDD